MQAKSLLAHIASEVRARREQGERWKKPRGDSGRLYVVSEISLERRLAAYSDGLSPEWDPVVLSQENVSWCLYLRDILESNIEKLSDDQRAVLEATDRVMIEHALEIAEWCEADGRWRERARERIPKERWCRGIESAKAWQLVPF